MYSQLLDTFLSVVDCKSLSKAAAKLFITPAAVMKQMNALESHLGMKLIKRSNQGIVLTAAGESIYKVSKKIMRESQRAIERAKAAQEEEKDLSDTAEFTPGAPMEERDPPRLRDREDEEEEEDEEDDDAPRSGGIDFGRLQFGRDYEIT